LTCICFKNTAFASSQELLKKIDYFPVSMIYGKILIDPKGNGK